MTEPVVVLPRASWRARSACKDLDPEIWYPEPGDDLGEARAKVVCQGCPVQMECLDHALTAPEEMGVWGGATERERRAIARRVHGTAARYRARCRCEDCVGAFDRRRETTRDRDHWLKLEE